jgi:hypothetical protein
MSRIKKLKASNRKKDDIIATFIIKDYREQGINFTIDEQGFYFPTQEDIEKSIARSKEMGYSKWLFGNDEPRIIEE